MRERRIASSVRAWLAQSKSCASVEAAPSERHDRPQAAPGTSLAGCFLRAACSARTLHRPPQAGCVRRARSYLPPELPFLGIREKEGRNRTRGRDGGERVGASQPGSRQPASQDDDEPARIAIGSQASPDGVVQDSDWEPAGGRSPVGSTSTSSSYSHPDRYRYSTWEGPLSRRSNDRPRNATDRNSFGRSGNNVISFTFWVKPSMPVSPLSASHLLRQSEFLFTTQSVPTPCSGSWTN